MELRKNITGVQHLGIPVLCMEETKKFYVENFGFEVFHEKQIFYPEKMNICFLKLGDLVVELYEHKNERQQVQSKIIDQLNCNGISNKCQMIINKYNI